MFIIDEASAVPETVILTAFFVVTELSIGDDGFVLSTIIELLSNYSPNVSSSDGLILTLIISSTFPIFNMFVRE